MKTYHVDGGAKCSPPDYKFHDAYFVVVDEGNELVHIDLDAGDIYSGLAEYKAIQWAVENIKDRPVKITSDCEVAMKWARDGGSRNYPDAPALDLTDIDLVYEKNNLADRYNAKEISPKHISGAPKDKLKKIIIANFGEGCYIANGNKIDGTYCVDKLAQEVIDEYWQ